MLRTASKTWLVAAVLIALVAVGLFAASRGPSEDGSVQLLGLGAPDEESEAGALADVGVTMGWSGITILNSGTEPVTLRSAKLSGSSDSQSARLIGTYLHAGVFGGKPDVAVWPSGYAEEGWTQATLMPVENHVLPAGERVELLFLFKALSNGQRPWDGVTVEFAKGSGTYVTKTQAGFRVCSPKSSACGASRG